MSVADRDEQRNWPWNCPSEVDHRRQVWRQLHNAFSHFFLHLTAVHQCSKQVSLGGIPSNNRTGWTSAGTPSQRYCGMYRFAVLNRPSSYKTAHALTLPSSSPHHTPSSHFTIRPLPTLPYTLAPTSPYALLPLLSYSSTTSLNYILPFLQSSLLSRLYTLKNAFISFSLVDIANAPSELSSLVSFSSHSWQPPCFHISL